MSTKHHNVAEKEIGKIQIHGKQGKYRKVPIDVDSIPGQRPTDKATIKEHFIKEGKALELEGAVFSYSLWSPPQVASYRDDKGNEQLVLFDGDHRRHMWVLAHPKDKEIMAYVVEVSELKDAQALFPKYNKTRRKAISPEALFICNCKMGDINALKEEKLLKTLGLRVASEPKLIDPLHSVPANSLKPHVPINAFRRAVKSCTKNDRINEEPLRYACKLLSELYLNANEYRSEEFQCLVALGVIYPEYLRNTKDQDILERHLHSVFKDSDATKKFNAWKIVGGNVHSMAAQSMVKGLIEEVRGLNNCPENFKRRMPTRKVQAVLDGKAYPRSVAA